MRDGANVKVTELIVDTADLSHISDEQFQSRTEGLHVSAIIQHIMVTSGLSEANDFTSNDLNLFAIIGRLWEQMLANVMFPAPRYVRPGELECEGIYGSPDAVDTHDACLMEFKVTWKSSRHEIGTFFKYMLQVKAYCYMLGLTRVRLYVCFVCGNYKPPLPQFRAWDIEFSPHEIKDAWRMILTNAKEMT